MKMMGVTFLIMSLTALAVWAQDPIPSIDDRPPVKAQDVVDEGPGDPMPPQPVRQVNPAQQALDAVINEQDLNNGIKQISNGLGERDPFQRPKYIDDLESDLNRDANLDTTEDERIEAIRRWPLRDYRATAIMWDIQNPKVMVVDRKGTLHLLKKNYRIGNRNGIITAINEGEIIVTENKIPVVITIEATSAK
jgi:Tfp pilus assembly protein PilP